MMKAEIAYNLETVSGEGISPEIVTGRTQVPVSGYDPKGFAVLPRYDFLLRRCWDVPASPEKHGWLLPKADMPGYASIVRYPVWTNNIGVIRGGSSITGGDWLVSASRLLGTYAASSSYIDVACGNPVLQASHAFPNGLTYNQSLTINATRTLQPVNPDPLGNPLRVFDVWLRWNEPYGGPESASLKWTCNLNQVFSDIQVGCSTAGCRVEKMILANNSTQQAITYSTPLDDDVLTSSLIDTLLLFPTPQTDLLSPNAMTKAIWWHLSHETRDLITVDNVSQSSILELRTTKVVNKVLTRYVNSFHMLSQSFLDGPQFPDKDGIIPDSTESDYLEIQLNAAIYKPHYAISWPWIAIDLALCLILLAASITAMTLRVNTLAPDILGSISSMTRDNPYLQLPGSGKRTERYRSIDRGCSRGSKFSLEMLVVISMIRVWVGLGWLGLVLMKARRL